jgi:hypothetical protein
MVAITSLILTLPSPLTSWAIEKYEVLEVSPARLSCVEPKLKNKLLIKASRVIIRNPIFFHRILSPKLCLIFSSQNTDYNRLIEKLIGKTSCVAVTTFKT